MSALPQPKKKKFYKRWWFWTILVIGSALVVAISAGTVAYKNSQKEALSYLKEIVSAETRTLKKTISTDGEITAEQSTQLFVSRPGTVTAVNYKIGDEVDKNDILVKTDGGAASDEEIKAPFDGKVLAIYTFEGDVSNGTSPLIEVGYRTNHIEFVASESEVINLRTGQHVGIVVPSYKNGKEEYNGEITFVDVQKQTFAQGSAATSGAVAESGYKVFVSINNLPDEIENIIGMSVDITVDIYETDKVLSLEPSAIQYDENDDAFVYAPPVINDAFAIQASSTQDITELLQKKYIEVGFEGDEYYEITDGLRDGETVLLYIPSNGTVGGLF